MSLLLLGDVLGVLGGVALTLAVVGAIRLPDAFARLHSASKAVVLGDAAILLASMCTLEWGIAARALLVLGFLLLTSPISAMAMARLEHARRSEGGNDSQRQEER
jgi:multicomponent Na+:H+ antiporter subunit G